MKLYVLIKVWEGDGEPGVQTLVAKDEIRACQALMELAYDPDGEEPIHEYFKLDLALREDPQGLAEHLTQAQADMCRFFYVEEHDP